MTLKDSHGGAVRLAGSQSETARFGLKVERLTVGHGWNAEYTRAELADRLRELVDTSSAHTIILRYPSEAQFVVQGLGDHGRQSFPSGSLLHWEHVGPTPPRQDDVDVLQSPGITSEVWSQIRSVIADSFTGYTNHYAANPFLGEDVVTEGYLEWAEATALVPRNRVFLISAHGKATGVATVECPEHGSHWEIKLAGVVAAAQGKGHYSRLVNSVIRTAHELDVPRVVISTQAYNVRVQRAWTRLGFVPYASIETVHLVSPNEE